MPAHQTLPAPLDVLAQELASIGTLERATKEKEYLKSARSHFGVPIPEIRKRAKALLKREKPDRERLWHWVDLLWTAGVHEMCFAATTLLRFGNQLDASDLPRIAQLIREAKTWALVDPLAIYVTGSLVEAHPNDADAVLDAWSTDEDFWVRRAAMLALLIPLRQGEGDWTRFTRYADAMLEEKEFFIRKAIGWVLRERAKRRPEEVIAWSQPRWSRMSGVTRREVVKPLSEADRARLVTS
ncbi:MAG: DNA alkylation repair protein [Acidobacteriota bacterium]